MMNDEPSAMDRNKGRCLLDSSGADSENVYTMYRDKAKSQRIESDLERRSTILNPIH